MLVLSTRKFPTTIIHSYHYYKTVLFSLIEGINRSLTHAAIAQLLNERGLLTPTGLKWQQKNVKEALKKIRLNREYSSRLHFKLLELIVAGEIQVKQAAPLFQQRFTGVM